MLAANQITRLLDSHDFTQVIDRILANGRCRSPLARVALRQPLVARVAALGLGLQRITELTYRPTPMADAIASQLSALQNERGLFVGPCLSNQPSNRIEGARGRGGDRRRAAAPLQLQREAVPNDLSNGVLGASAVAIHGLIRWRQQLESNRLLNQSFGADAIERGLDAIANCFEQERESNQRHRNAIDWAIVLWQLGDIDRFRVLVPIDELLDTLETSDTNLLHDELCRYAQAAAA